MIRLFFSLLIILLLVSLFGNQAKAQLKPAQSQYLEQVGSFINPGFEQGFKGWTISGCTKSVVTQVPYLGNSLQITCLNEGFSASQSTDKLVDFVGLKYVAQCLVKSSVAGVSVTTKVNGVLDKSTTTATTDWEIITFRGDIGNVSNEIDIEIPLYLGDVFVDDCSLKIDKSIFSKGVDGQFLVKDSENIEGVGWSNTLQGVLNPTTNWTPYQVITDNWDNTTFSMRYRQIADSADVEIKVDSFSGAPTNGADLILTLPFNVPDNMNGSTNQFGSGQITTQDGTRLTIFAQRINSNQIRVKYQTVAANAASGLETAIIRNLNAAGVTRDTTVRPWGVNASFFLKFSGIEVEGWSSGLDSVVRNSNNTPHRAGDLVWNFGATKETGDVVLADGDCYLKSDYPDFMANVGTLYGECTISTTNDGFNVPNIENRFVRSAGGALTVGTKQSDTTAVNGLSATTTGNTDNDTHNHTVPRANGTGGSSLWYQFANNNSLSDGSTNNDTHNHSLNATTNLSGDSETRPDSIVLTAYVRLKNIDNVIAGVFEQIESVDATLDATTANEFSARFNNGGGVISENYDWIQGNCTEVTTGQYACNLNPSISASTLSYNVSTVDGGSACRVAKISNTGGTTFTVRTYNTGQNPTACAFDVHASKQGVDVNKTVKGVIVGASSLKTECQTKFLSADITTDTDPIGDLTFNNLEVGKKYLVEINGLMEFDTADGAISFTSEHDGASVCRSISGSAGGTPTNEFQGSFQSCRFQAATTTLTHAVSSLTSGNALSGNGGVRETNVTLCQLPDNTILNSNKWD